MVQPFFGTFFGKMPKPIRDMTASEYLAAAQLIGRLKR
jgi:hypothetical protein